MPQGFEAGRVSAARLLSPRVRNVAIAAESFAGFAFEPGADVAIRLPGGDGETEERHYSVWKSTVEGTVELCVVLHGLGPGEPVGRAVRDGGSGRDLAFPRSADSARPLGTGAPAFRRRDLDRVSRCPDPSFASGGGCVRVLRSCFDGPSLARPRGCSPRRHSLGRSRRATRLGARLLARAPKLPLRELHDRLCDR
jgi:hypothetical protein